MPSLAEAAESLFAACLAALTPTPQELAAGRAAAAEVVALLRRHFRPRGAGRDDCLVAGSYGKRTAIRPLPAVDLYYIIPEDAGGPPACGAALRAVAEALGERAVPDGWRVAVGEAPIVAVVPCLEYRGAFAIPGESGWRISNPAAEAAALRLADRLSDGRFARLLALAKAWRATAGARLSSFAVEVLAREFLAVTPVDGTTPGLLGDFLAWSRRHTPAEFELPGGMAALAVDDGWHGQAEAGYWRCVLAERHLASGAVDQAAAEWARLLGPLFPHHNDNGGNTA